MKVAVVTGATSFIGAPLVEKLSKNYFVYAIIRPSYKNIKNLTLNENIKIIECDLNNYSELEKKILCHCDVFYHIAWNGTRVPERDNAELQDKNYKSSIVAYNAAKTLGCNCFISIGSQAEYGKCEDIIRENYPCSPITEYGKAKLKVYQELKKRSSQDHIKFAWIRIFSAYGPNDYENSLISMCINRMKKNEDVFLTKGNQMWNYIYIEDIVNILILLDNKTNYRNEVFNVCSLDTRSIKDFVEEIKNIIGSKSNLYYGAKEYNSSEGIINLFPDCSKLINMLKYKNFVSFSDGIKQTIDYMSK